MSSFIRRVSSDTERSPSRSSTAICCADNTTPKMERTRLLYQNAAESQIGSSIVFHEKHPMTAAAKMVHYMSLRTPFHGAENRKTYGKQAELKLCNLPASPLAYQAQESSVGDRGSAKAYDTLYRLQSVEMESTIVRQSNKVDEKIKNRRRSPLDIPNLA